MKLARIPLLVVLVLVGLLTACSKTGKPSPDTQVIIPETTKVADGVTRDALTEYDPDTGIMRFSAHTAALANLKPDDVLVSEPSAAAPHGYLRKVKAMRQEGDVVILETTQAALTDAIYQGELDFERELEPEDLLEPEVFVEGLSITPALDPQAGFKFTARFDETVLDITEGGVRSQVHVNGSLSFNVDVHVGLAIGGKVLPWPDIYVKRFEASAGVAQRAELRISGDANAKFTKDIQVASVPFSTFCLFIGPVPLCFSPTMYMFVGASGEVNLRFDYQVVQTFEARVGARYAKGRGWENIGLGPTFDTTLGQTPSINARLKASGYTRAEIGLMLYGLAGPTFGVKLGVELDAAIPRDPFWTLSGFLEAYYGLVVQLPILGRVADHRDTIFKVSKEVGRSPNSPPIIEVKQSNIRIDHGQPVDFTWFRNDGGCLGIFCIFDPEDGVPSYTLTSDKDGVLPKGQYTFATAGLRTVTIRATDRKGASASASFRVDVVNTPPTAYGSASTDSVPQGVEFWVSASASDPNTQLDCSALTWSATAPDTVAPTVVGTDVCYGKAIFNIQGTRAVTLTAQDPEGAVSRPRTFSVYVTAPPPNQPPVTTAGGEFTVRENRRNTSGGTYSRILKHGAEVRRDSWTTGYTLSVHAYDPERPDDPNAITYTFAASCGNCRDKSRVTLGSNHSGTLELNSLSGWYPGRLGDEFPGRHAEIYLHVAVSDGTTAVQWTTMVLVYFSDGVN